MTPPEPPLRRSRLIDRTPVFYGWLVLAVATVGMMMTIAGQTVGVSIFIDWIIAGLRLDDGARLGELVVRAVPAGVEHAVTGWQGGPVDAGVAQQTAHQRADADEAHAALAHEVDHLDHLGLEQTSSREVRPLDGAGLGHCFRVGVPVARAGDGT